MRYDHTQTGPWYLILAVLGAGALVAAWFVPPVPGWPDWVVRLVLVAYGSGMFLFALGFRQLNVSDESGSLLVAFGPLPVFRRRLAYSDIESVKRGRTSVLDGWGIHWRPGAGWTWSIWGFDCVIVQLKKGSTWQIGTDDAEALERFLTEQLDALAEEDG